MGEKYIQEAATMIIWVTSYITQNMEGFFLNKHTRAHLAQ